MEQFRGNDMSLIKLPRSHDTRAPARGNGGLPPGKVNDKCLAGVSQYRGHQGAGNGNSSPPLVLDLDIRMSVFVECKYEANDYVKKILALMVDLSRHPF